LITSVVSGGMTNTYLFMEPPLLAGVNFSEYKSFDSFDELLPSSTRRIIPIQPCCDKDEQYEEIMQNEPQGTPEKPYYGLTDNNCCHWARRVIKKAGDQWPLRNDINHGANRGNPAGDWYFLTDPDNSPRITAFPAWEEEEYLAMREDIRKKCGYYSYGGPADYCDNALAFLKMLFPEVSQYYDERGY
jgi:hypothetical protein